MNYTKNQLAFLVLMRMAIGWHFLYEALLKLFSPSWTSKGFLVTAEGPFGWLFQWLGSDAMVGFTDIITISLLLVAGISLLLGFREKAGAWAGILLLASFYLAHPAFPWLEGTGPTEGNYLIINKNLIELLALGVIAFFPTSQYFGIDHFTNKKATS